MGNSGSSYFQACLHRLLFLVYDLKPAGSITVFIPRKIHVQHLHSIGETVVEMVPGP